MLLLLLLLLEPVQEHRRVTMETVHLSPSFLIISILVCKDLHYARIRNTTIRQGTRVTDIVQYVTNTKWKWAGHIARMRDNRWTISRSTEWQIEGARSVGRPKRR